MRGRDQHCASADLCIHNRLRVERYLDSRHRRAERLRSAPRAAARACGGDRCFLRGRRLGTDRDWRRGACKDHESCSAARDAAHRRGHAVPGVVRPAGTAARLSTTDAARGRRRTRILANRRRAGGRLHLPQSPCLSRHGPADGNHRSAAAGGLEAVVRGRCRIGERAVVHGSRFRRAYATAAVLAAAGLADPGSARRRDDAGACGRVGSSSFERSWFIKPGASVAKTGR